MSDREIAKLMELADEHMAKVRTMTKKEVILSLNESGILTKKGKFMKAYSELEKATAAK